MAPSHRRAGGHRVGQRGPHPAGRHRARTEAALTPRRGAPFRALRASTAGGKGRRVLRSGGALRMQIVLFYLMPYADLDLAAGRKNGTVWVTLPTLNLDPPKGMQLSNR